ncbi:MAG: sodium:alanine symporter family protein, partial [Tenericutes bacterium]|nr:sodium:alanine symporter family protein [Mycoplasmatota bacterium]
MLIVLNKLLWGILSIILISMGLKYTFKFRFLQFNLKKIVKSIYTDTSVLKPLCLSLSGKIGVGSISGVALAIYLGGPGTIFWLWISSFIVAPLSFIEAYLAIKYKEKQNEEFIGGPYSYINKGLNRKKLATTYALLIILAYIIGFLTIQSNTISKLISSVVQVNPLVIGIIIAVLTFLIIIKGIKEISLITLFLTPLMTISYIILGL